MAKNEFSLTYRANTVQENETMLQESYKNETDTKYKDYKRLFAKFNHVCQAKSTKDQAQLNPSWHNKNITIYTYGPIDGFPSGSWWGIRMDCSRDCVHSPFDKDIQDGPFGVTSICTSSTNQNEDIDLGTSLTVTGQKYLDGNIDPLVKNYENQIPLRLIRSYNLLNKFAPKTGYRYDGLYLVTSFWIGINPDSVKVYKFSLSRVTTQEPLSCGVKELVSTSTGPSTSVPIQDDSKSSVPNMYEFKKYSHSSDSVAQKEKTRDNSNGSPYTINKRNNEKERIASESAIVTRHVFKKVNPTAECNSNVPSTSAVSENKLLTHIGSQGSKTLNTNISIRTGLYDSSHSAQNDTKKNTLSPFCRTAKSLNMLKNNQYMENWNSPIKDKGKNLDGKATLNESSKRVNYMSVNAVKLEPVKLTFPKDAEMNATSNGSSPCHRYEYNNTPKEITNDSTNANGTALDATTNTLNCLYKNETLMNQIVSRNDQESKVLDSLDLLTPDRILHLIKSKDNPLSKLLMGNMIGLTAEQTVALQTRNKAGLEVGKKVGNDTEEKERTEFEVGTDDLTASRSYKFRRRRRLSRKTMNKSDATKCIKVYNKIFNNRSGPSLDGLQHSRRDKTDVREGSKEEVQQNCAQKRETNCLRDSNVEKNVGSGKETCYNRSAPSLDGLLRSRRDKRDTREGAKKEVQRNRGQKRETNCLRDSNVEKNVGSAKETYLQPARTTDSSTKKHRYKKQRREITNLLIDAKIAPKIRGPRYRRLRARNHDKHTCAKPSYERYDTRMCTLSTRRVKPEQSSFRNRNKLARIANRKRIRSTKNGRYVSRSEKLNVKRDAVDSKATISKKIDDNSDVNRFSGINNNENENNNVDNKKKSKFSEKIRVKTVENKNIMFIKNQKRKLVQTVYRESKCRKIEEELKNGYESEISKPYKADAVTQCSLIKEPLMRNEFKSGNSKQNNVRNEQHIFIRIEYGDFKDMKSELCESMKPANENKSDSTTFISNEKCMPCRKPVYRVQRSENARVSLNNDNILNTKDRNECPSERMSAFVPVNIPDNDVKIARLRSIGFKPIDFTNDDGNVDEQEGVAETEKRDVAEKYDKYTNEESDIVVYMDDELQYQDIENEDTQNSSSVKRKMSMDSAVCVVKEERLSGVPEDESMLEQELESPWHGWRKVVTNEDTYWVGW